MKSDRVKKKRLKNTFLCACFIMSLTSQLIHRVSSELVFLYEACQNHEAMFNDYKNAIGQ
jgi:hypothetical protein